MQKIQNKSNLSSSLVTAILLVILLALLCQSRFVVSAEVKPALVYLQMEEHIWVEACRGSDCHIYDVSCADSVGQMTLWLGLSPNALNLQGDSLFESGRSVWVSQQHPGAEDRINLGWMRAGKRMALGIALHPDKMDLQDWDDMPGIGPGLAERIIAHRHKNGEFGSLQQVQQVKGIGSRKIAALERWF